MQHRQRPQYIGYLLNSEFRSSPATDNTNSICTVWDDSRVHYRKRTGIYLFSGSSSSSCTINVRRNAIAARPPARLQLEYGRAARRLRREHVQAQIALLDHSPVDPWFVVLLLRKTQVNRRYQPCSLVLRHGGRRNERSLRALWPRRANPNP